MFKFIFSIFKRIIIAVLLIYAYNRMALPLNEYIPINVVTILLVSLFGMPSILMLIIFSICCI